MEPDPVLSRDEIEALLSAIRSPETVEAPLRPWDFRRPRRLRAADFERLRELLSPLLETVSRVFEKALYAPVQTRLLAPTESTPAELLEGRSGEGLLARAGDVLIDPSPPVAFALVERALGGGRLTRPPDRPLRDLEAELLSPVLAGLLEALAPAWALTPASPIRWATASDFAREPWPEGSCAVIGLEIMSEGLLGDILLGIPVSRFEPLVARPVAADPGQPAGVDIEVAARFPIATLRLGDLRDLAPGDLLVWGGDAAPEMTVEVSKKPRFSGRPGSLAGKAAVEVLRPAGREPAPAMITRQAGGGESTGAPDVPVEVRVVLAERAISLRDLGGLRPGGRIEFPRAWDAPVDLRLGDRVVARGTVVRSGDRLAVRVETDIESGRQSL